MQRRTLVLTLALTLTAQCNNVYKKIKINRNSESSFKHVIKDNKHLTSLVVCVERVSQC